jgi:glycosyltransferase involved in cell wall biosynthesis
MHMRFTVVTPVMNGITWLAECVASVEAQRADVDVEHIILDPGSTDGSREWLRQHAAHATLVFERDDGQTDALSRGFARASGNVLGWLNADDLLEAGALARVRDAFERAPGAVGVSGEALTIDMEGRVTGVIRTPRDGSLAGLLASPGNMAQPSTFFRRKAYIDAGGLDASVDLAMDVALWLRLARLAPFALMPGVVLSRFRIHGDARSVRDAGRTAREDLRIRRRAGMALLSPAGLALVRFGYVRPALVSLGRMLPQRLRHIVRGRPKAPSS